MRGLADFPRSTAPSNGMDAKRSSGVPLSSPAAAQRCAEGAGLDSGAPDAAQSAMPSIATPAASPTADHFHLGRCACAASAQTRISTSLTDVTLDRLLGQIPGTIRPDARNQQEDALALTGYGAGGAPSYTP